MDSMNKQFEIFFISEGQKHCAFGVFENEAQAVESILSSVKERGMNVSDLVAVSIPYSEDINSKTWTFSQWGDVVVSKDIQDDVMGLSISIERPDISGFLELKEDVDLGKAWEEATIEFTVYFVEKLIQEHKQFGGGSLQGLIESMLQQLAEDCQCEKCQARRKEQGEG